MSTFLCLFSNIVLSNMFSLLSKNNIDHLKCCVMCDIIINSLKCYLGGNVAVFTAVPGSAGDVRAISPVLQSSGRRHTLSCALCDPWAPSVKEEEACLISRPLVAKFASAQSRSFDIGLMSKDGRHDGRRRGAGQQHRLGLRSGQSGDGRDRSASNSSGSSHGGGKGRNTPISIALKVTNNSCLKT